MLATILAFVIHPNQEPKVSLTLRAVRAVNAAPELAKSFGVQTVEVGRTIANDVLLVRANNIDAIDLRSKIATTLNATWEQTPTGWKVYQTAGQIKQEQTIHENKGRELLLAKIRIAKESVASQKSITNSTLTSLGETMEETFTSKAKFTNAQRAKLIADFNAMAPESRFMERIVAKLTPSVVSLVSLNQPRVVLSSAPTKMQVEIPFDISADFEQFEKENKMWDAMVSNHGLEFFNYRHSNLGRYRVSAPFDEAPKSKKVALVTMTLHNELGGIQFEAYNAAGDSIHSFEYEVPADIYDPAKEKLISDKRKLIRSKPPVLTLEEIEWVNLHREKDSPTIKPEVSPVSPNLLAKILQPEIFDPLSILCSDVILQSVETPNVVMVLEDTQMASRNYYSPVDFPEDQEGMKFTQDSNWLLVSPKDPIGVRENQLDRGVLGRSIRMSQSQSRNLSLEEKAAVAVTAPWYISFNSGYSDYIKLLRPRDGDSFFSGPNLNLYGALSPSERDLAKKGISVGKLSDTAKLAVFRAIYYGDGFLNFEMPHQEHEILNFEEYEKKQREIDRDINREPTYAVPTGLQNSMIVTLEEQSEVVLSCQLESVDDYDHSTRIERDLTSPESVGEKLFESKQPSQERDSTFLDRGILIFTARSIGIKVTIAPNVFQYFSLTDYIAKDGRFYTTSTLPEEIKKLVQKGYKEAEEHDSEMKKYIPPVSSTRGKHSVLNH